MTWTCCNHGINKIMNLPARQSSNRLIILPVVLIVLASAVAFLPLVGKLGFYHDDWFTTASRVSGISLEAMHSIDRPQMGTVYTILSDILGESPLAWQLFSWIARTITGLLFWIILRIMFPNQNRLSLIGGLLFVLYPGFLQQPSANNYSNHWVALLLAMLSLLLTVRASTTRYSLEAVVETTVASGLIVVYPRIYETFIGFEALRVIFVLWICLRQPGNVWRRWLKSALLLLFPLLIGTYFLYWRFFIFNSVRVSTDETALLAQLLTTPGVVIGQVAIGLVTGFWKTVGSAWLEPLLLLWNRSPEYAQFLGVILGLLAGFTIWFVLNRKYSLDDRVSWSPVWLGALGVALTLLPVLVIGRTVNFRDYMDRYTLQSIAPTALLLAGLAEIIGKRWGSLLTGCLVLFAVLLHIVNSGAYVSNWQVQQSFWWQMAWRAPQLAEGTNLIAYMPPGYRYPEEFEVWAPGNRIYAPEAGKLWLTAALLGEDSLAEVEAGGQVERDFRTIQYVKDYDKSLLISQPTLQSCIHVLDGAHPILAGSEPNLLRQVASISRFDQIIVDAEPAVPPKTIFGAEPEHGWCYYYQKADLAVQKQDYAQAAQLADAAAAGDYVPQDVVEWMPFYRGYAYVGRTQDALGLAAAIRSDAGFIADYCGQYNLEEIPNQSNMEAFIIMNLCLPENPS